MGKDERKVMIVKGSHGRSSSDNRVKKIKDEEKVKCKRREVKRR